MPIPLNNQLCYSLYATSIAINRTYKPMLDAMGITYPQYLVLNVLGEDKDLTIGAIAERLALEPSTITPAVKRMESAGLVERRRGTKDERQVHVCLTETGKALFERSSCLGAMLIERSGMSPDAVDALNEQVKSLRTALTGDRQTGATFTIPTSLDTQS